MLHTEDVVQTYNEYSQLTSHDIYLASNKRAHVVLPDPLLLQDLEGHKLLVVRIGRKTHLSRNTRSTILSQRLLFLYTGLYTTSRFSLTMHVVGQASYVHRVFVS